MKITSDELPKGQASVTIKHQEMDRRIELSEQENKCIGIAQKIAKKEGISMVDYSDYNREMAALKEMTDNYLNFTDKFKMSLR